MLNKVILHGRLANDPAMRQTAAGKKVCSFTLAQNGGTNISYFFDCVCWERTAEFVSKYFQKGKEMIVEGRLQTRTYTDKNGNNRKAVDVVVESVDFCGSKEKANDDFVEVEDAEDLPF